MIRSTSTRLSVLAAIFALAITFFSLPARAADNEVANPQYTAWASFKPGSSVTLACDMKVGPKQIDAHMERTTKLVEVNAGNLVLEVTSEVKVMDHTSTMPANKITVKATGPAKDFKDAGEADVAAGGKTYKCKVIEITGDSAAASAPRTGRPAGGTYKVTAYINHDVPGGIVKMDATNSDGKSMTFLLTATDVK